MESNIPVKHRLGKMLAVTAIGFIVTLLVEKGYDKAFHLEQKDD